MFNIFSRTDCNWQYLTVFSLIIFCLQISILWQIHRGKMHFTSQNISPMIDFDPNFDIIFQKKIVDYLVNKKFVCKDHKNTSCFLEKKGGLFYFHFHLGILISAVNCIIFKNNFSFFVKNIQKNGNIFL